MERVVTVLDHEVHLVGEDGDSFIQDLPGVVREPALDYAELTLADDAIVIDAGASLGVLSLGFSFIAPRGRVIAIEASPNTYRRLVDNLAGANATNVETMNLAVGESAGTLEFFSSPWFSAGSFVKKFPANVDLPNVVQQRSGAYVFNSFRIQPHTRGNLCRIDRNPVGMVLRVFILGDKLLQD